MSLIGNSLSNPDACSCSDITSTDFEGVRKFICPNCAAIEKELG